MGNCLRTKTNDGDKIQKVNEEKTELHYDIDRGYYSKDGILEKETTEKGEKYLLINSKKNTVTMKNDKPEDKAKTIDDLSVKQLKKDAFSRLMTYATTQDSNTLTNVNNSNEGTIEEEKNEENYQEFKSEKKDSDFSELEFIKEISKESALSLVLNESKIEHEDNEKNFSSDSLDISYNDSKKTYVHDALSVNIRQWFKEHTIEDTPCYSFSEAYPFSTKESYQGAFMGSMILIGGMFVGKYFYQKFFKKCPAKKCSME